MGKIVWLASYPKSGNTWLRAFLHNYVAPGSRPYDINNMMRFTASETSAALYAKHDPRPMSSYTMGDVMRLRPLVHRDLAAMQPTLALIKTHNAAISVEQTPLITPDLTEGAIYIVRDPRDVAVSYAAFQGISVDETIALMNKPGACLAGRGEQVFEWLGRWSDHVSSWTSGAIPNVLTLRYEDLLADPIAHFGQVVAMLEGRVDPQRLEAAVQACSFDVLRSQEQQGGFGERPAGSPEAFFRVGKSGQWRNTLTPGQAAEIEAAHGAVMERFRFF